MERETLVEILRQSDPETLTLQEGPPLEAEAKEGAQLTLLLQSGSRALGELRLSGRMRERSKKSLRQVLRQVLGQRPRRVLRQRPR